MNRNWKPPAGSNGFKASAAYFEARAASARTLVERKQMQEWAAFYLDLAAIVPTFPAGFKRPLYSGNHFRKRGIECAALADSMSDGEPRAMMMAMAQQYERLADHYDGIFR